MFHTLQRVASKLDQASTRLQRQAKGAASATDSLQDKVADDALRQRAPSATAVAAAHAEPHSAHVRPDKAPHIPGFAPLKAAAPLRPPPGRSWLEEGNPFYKQRGSGHKCVKLGRVLFEDPHKTGGSEEPARSGSGSSGSIGKRTLEVEFPPWRMAWPHMASAQHVDWFKGFEIAGWRRRSNCGDSDGWLAFCEPSYTHGAVTVTGPVVVSGTGQQGHDCGPNGELRILEGNGAAALQPGQAPYAVNGTLFWGDIPAVWTYQHWMENTLPKIAQALLLEPDLVQPATAPPGSPTAIAGDGTVTAVQELLLDRYPIIAKIYDGLGWSVADERFRAVTAARIAYSCRAPPLHPYLWQLGQVAVLGVEPLPLAQRDTIVYCGRTGVGRIENAGRRVLNEDEDVLPALQALAKKRGLKVERFDHTKLMGGGVAGLRKHFAKARALVGPHGGCLTNVVWMGCGSSVVEIFPMINMQRTPVGHPAFMMYMQASFVEADYSMLPVDTPHENGDATVPAGDLVKLLEASLDRVDAAYSSAAAK